MTAGCTIHRGIPPDLTLAAAQFYWHHFGHDLQPLPLSPSQGTALVQALMRPWNALVAVTPSGQVLGIAGLRGAQGGFLALHPEGFISILGPLQGRARYWATALCLGGPATPDLILDGVAVRKGWRGRGLARAMVAAAEAEAHRRGYPALRAEVAATNRDALAAWQAMGFRPIGRQRLGWIWRPPAHVLRRPVGGVVRDL